MENNRNEDNINTENNGNDTETNNTIDLSNDLRTKEGEDLIKEINESFDRAENKISNFFNKIAKGKAANSRNVNIKLPWYLVVIIFLLAYNAGLFESMPGVRAFIRICLNVYDWFFDKVVALISWLCQGPFPWMDHIFFR